MSAVSVWHVKMVLVSSFLTCVIHAWWETQVQRARVSIADLELMLEGEFPGAPHRDFVLGEINCKFQYSCILMNLFQSKIIWVRLLLGFDKTNWKLIWIIGLGFDKKKLETDLTDWINNLLQYIYAWVLLYLHWGIFRLLKHFYGAKSARKLICIQLYNGICAGCQCSNERSCFCALILLYCLISIWTSERLL